MIGFWKNGGHLTVLDIRGKVDAELIISGQVAVAVTGS